VYRRPVTVVVNVSADREAPNLAKGPSAPSST